MSAFGSPLGDPESTVRRTVLPGGLRVVTEFLPAVRSVALGIWVGVGSRDEDEAHAGATHYLEHLLFKGTHQRTALDISAAMDAVGGELNAFTAKEYTCYYARVARVQAAFETALLATSREAPAPPRLRKSGAVLWEGYGPFAGAGVKLV